MKLLGICLCVVGLLVICLMGYLICKKKQKNKVYPITPASEAPDRPVADRARPKLREPGVNGMRTPNGPAPNRAAPRCFPGVISQPGGIP